MSAAAVSIYFYGAGAVFVVALIASAGLPPDDRRDDTPFQDALVCALLWPMMACGLAMVLVAIGVTKLLGKPTRKGEK